MIVSSDALVCVLVRLADHEIKVGLSRHLCKHNFIGRNDASGALHTRISTTFILFVILSLLVELRLQLVLKLGDLKAETFDFMPVLRLLMLNLGHGLDEFVALACHLLKVSLMLLLGCLQLVAKINNLA